jgi:hypothetical protein
MKKSARTFAALALPMLAILASCGSSGDEKKTDPAEVKRKAEWLQRYASQKPQEAERFSAECQKEVGLSMTKEGALAFIDCVEAKSKKAPASPPTKG